MPSTYSGGSSTPRASQSGVSIVADTRAFSRLARDLRRAAPEAWRECRRALRAAAIPVAEDAKARAGFSSRIPGTIRIRTGVGNVKIVAGGANAPDAAPLENKGRGGDFRHPVFGNRDVWVSQRARPFLAPALEAHREQVAHAIEAAVTEAVKNALGSR